MDPHPSVGDHRFVQIVFREGGFKGIPTVVGEFQTVSPSTINPKHKFAIVYAEFEKAGGGSIVFGSTSETITKYNIDAKEVQGITAPASTGVYYHYLAVGEPPRR